MDWIDGIVWNGIFNNGFLLNSVSAIKSLYSEIGGKHG